MAPSSHSLFFAGRFLRNPARIGSVVPSSRGLRDRMFEGLSLGPSQPVLEFGPGTGAFTLEVDAWRRRGIAVPYLGIERDRGMYERLVERFPNLDFVLGDVAHAVDICAGREFPPAAAVISGLPLTLLGRTALATLLESTWRCMRPGGVFRTFSYLHWWASRRARHLRADLAAVFDGSGARAFVFSNLPPAVVLEGIAPAELRARAGLVSSAAKDPSDALPELHGL